jgi:hypothetical protein
LRSTHTLQPAAISEYFAFSAFFIFDELGVFNPTKKLTWIALCSRDSEAADSKGENPCDTENGDTAQSCVTAEKPASGRGTFFSRTDRLD